MSSVENQRESLPEPDFRRLFEAAPAPYLVLDPRLSIVGVSDAYLRATMTERAAILGRHLFEVFPDNPDDVDATGVSNLRRSLETVVRTGRPDAMAVQKYDIRRPESEGGAFEVRYWSPINTPVLGASGELLYIIHRVEDVTDFVTLKQRDTELRTRAGQMEAEVFQRAQEIQAANGQLRETQEALRRTNEGLEARVAERTTAYATANAALKNEIVQRQRAQEALERTAEQLRQSQKMEAIGRLAGGIAHDFNNLLSVVLSYSELLRRELPEGDQRREDAAEIHKAGERAAALTRQLLAFSRQQVLKPTVVDLNAILTGMGRMFERVIGEDIELVMNPAKDLAHVRVDPGQIEQVLMNLVVNARDAMPKGGRLTIETGTVIFDQGYAEAHPGVFAGAHSMLAVTDTGVGMTKEVQARIFEPFFTTKEQGKGTGLGLSMVLGIVQQSGGHLWCYSEVGIGTTFKVYFRSVSDPLETEETRGSGVRARATGRVLLVEDDDQVRALVRGILSREGYVVTDAASPRHALAVFGTPGQAFDLLLTDVVMPQMNGRQLAELLREEQPTLRVVYMSGYTDDAVMRSGALSPGAFFVQKPIMPHSLLSQLHAAMTAPLPG